MRAIVIEPGADRARLPLREVPDPTPGPADLLVSVRAAALNRADLAAKPYHDGYSPSPTDLPMAGIEMGGGTGSGSG